MSSADLLDLIRARLAADPDWRRFVGAGEGWICPRCRQPVMASAPTRPALLAAIRDHLADGCAPAAIAGDGALAASHLLANVRHRLRHDLAWQARGRDRWRCPACLEAVAMASGVDADAAARVVVAHLAGCAAWARGELHDAAAVADADARAQGAAPAAPEPAEAAAPADERGEDLARARAVQQRLMREPPTAAGVRFATRYEPCSEISGDFNQFIPLPGGRVAFAQGDVSGHGVQAGLIMVMANKIIELYGAQDLPPKEVATRLNQALAGDLAGRMFITMAYVLLDPARRELRWVRCGHNPTLLRSRGGTTRQLLPKGMMVGTPQGELFARVLAEEVTPLAPGDTVVLFTDGITEAMSPEDEEFGLERMMAAIDRCGDAGAEAVVAAIMSDVVAFRRGRAMADDASLIALTIE